MKSVIVKSIAGIQFVQTILLLVPAFLFFAAGVSSPDIQISKSLLLLIQPTILVIGGIYLWKDKTIGYYLSGAIHAIAMIDYSSQAIEWSLSNGFQIGMTVKKYDSTINVDLFSLILLALLLLGKNLKEVRKLC